MPAPPWTSEGRDLSLYVPLRSLPKKKSVEKVPPRRWSGFRIGCA